MNVSSKEFKQKGLEGIILDVRTPAEFMQSHIPMAVNIDFYHDDFDKRIAALDKDKTYFVYCKTGNRSERTIYTMKELGFTKIYHLEGGIQQWIKDGFEIE